MPDDIRIPDDLVDVFREPALGHLSYHNPKGQIVTFPMWVTHDGEHVVTSSRVGSAKGKALRVRPEVSVSVVSTKNPWRWLSVSGRVSDIQPDEGLVLIDELSRRYTGQDYQARTPREKFLIMVDRVSKSSGG